MSKETEDLEQFMEAIGFPSWCITSRKDANGVRHKVPMTLAERVRLAILIATGEDQDDSFAAEIFNLEKFPDVPRPMPGEPTQESIDELRAEVKKLAVRCIPIFDPDDLRSEEDIDIDVHPVNDGLYWEAYINDASSNFEDRWVAISPIYCEDGERMALEALRSSLLSLLGSGDGRLRWILGA